MIPLLEWLQFNGDIFQFCAVEMSPTEVVRENCVLHTVPPDHNSRVFSLTLSSWRPYISPRPLMSTKAPLRMLLWACVMNLMTCGTS